MRVAVTGGSGVVGGAVLRHLLAERHDVRALVRSAATAETMAAAGAEPVLGDVLDAASIERLVDRCDWVFHVAGVNEMCSPDPTLMWRVNVDGSVVVLEACARAGVRRLVLTSSAVTLGEVHGSIGSENVLHRGYFQSDYERSKTVSERLLLHTTRDVEVVAVNPSSVQGPGRSTGTGAIFLSLARGRLPVLVDTTISLVDIDDCARGHLLAAERGVAGERYVLSGATLSIREGARMINQVMGRRNRPWFIRSEVVTGLAPLVGAGFRAFGDRPPLCPESARVLLSGHRYDGTRASEDLGLSYQSVDETLRRTVDWFGASGLL